MQCANSQKQNINLNKVNRTNSTDKPTTSVLWHCWLGDRKGIRPAQSWVLVCWWWHLTAALYIL